ncbi:hypothetical protein HPB52_015801 [Rhipicephalus sanguineus]|uniref:THAP-type domain-containing protein n=1 Tax=Rhipicephalus sanguineus TaxID=34632 RepID=A0A9D4T7N8_RHISA|nr:hypothetical protein HPB52_015801 [Rhipicephalus sanguineus]
MPNYCVAYGCRSTYGRDEVAFHKFPRDQKMAAKWVSAVKRKCFKPTRSSVLCSKHFRDSDYVRSPSLTQSLGLTIKCVRLNSDAVPSVFPHLRGPSPPPRLAFAKRRKTEVAVLRRFCGGDAHIESLGNARIASRRADAVLRSFALPGTQWAAISL